MVIGEPRALPALSIPNSFLCVAASPGPNLRVACRLARRTLRDWPGIGSDRLPYRFTFPLLSFQLLICHLATPIEFEARDSAAIAV